MTVQIWQKSEGIFTNHIFNHEKLILRTQLSCSNPLSLLLTLVSQYYCVLFFTQDKAFINLWQKAFFPFLEFSEAAVIIDIFIYLVI